MSRQAVEDFESDTESESPFNACNPFRIIRDKWTRKYRNPRTKKTYTETVKFPFSRLPKELQSATLQSIDINESLLLLKMNKNMKNLALYNGPFHRKVDEICLNFLASSDSQTFQIRVYQRNRIFRDFQIDKLCKFGYLVKLIKNCKTLSLNRESRNVDILPETLARLQYNFEICNPYSNLKNIGNFNIGGDLEFGKLFFSNFQPKSIDEVMLNLKWKEEEKEEIQIFLLNLVERPEIQSSRKLFWKGQMDWEIFRNLNTEMFLNLTTTEWKDYQQNLRIFLENGIPSRNGRATAGIRAILNLNAELFEAGQIFQAVRDLIESFERIEQINDQSDAAKVLNETLPRIDDFYRVLLEGRSQQGQLKAFYKRRISPEKLCIYLLTVHHANHTFWKHIDVQFFMKYIEL